MPVFRTASRTADEMKTAKEALNDEFSIVRGANGSLNRKAVKELEDSKWELAELIIQLIDDEVAATDPTPFLAEVVSGDIRNEYIWQEVTSDLRVVTRAYGTKPTSQRLQFTEFPITTTHREVVVEIPLEEVASGRVTPQLVSEVMADTIIRFRISNLLDSLDAGVASGADRSGVAGYTLRYSGLTAANLDKAIDGIMDESEDPTIFGRHIALAPAIRGFSGYADLTQKEFDERGVIGRYHGANIVSLRDKYSRRAGSHVIRSDRAYLASGTKGAIFMEKDVSFLDFVEIIPRTSTFTVGTRIEDGLLVWDPFQYRIIEV